MCIQVYVQYKFITTEEFVRNDLTEDPIKNDIKSFNKLKHYIFQDFNTKYHLSRLFEPMFYWILFSYV